MGMGRGARSLGPLELELSETCHFIRSPEAGCITDACLIPGGNEAYEARQAVLETSLAVGSVEGGDRQLGVIADAFDFACFWSIPWRRSFVCRLRRSS